jgi:hypothetical protein
VILSCRPFKVTSLDIRCAPCSKIWSRSLEAYLLLRFVPVTTMWISRLAPFEDRQRVLVVRFRAQLAMDPGEDVPDRRVAREVLARELMRDRNRRDPPA